MGNNYVIVTNEASRGSWIEWMWSDINQRANILLDNNVLTNPFARRLKKLHFSNSLNKKVWIPFKWAWDRYLSLKLEDLSSKDVNYVIFQSNIKFSPRFIKKLKNNKNARIILYLPDTTTGIGIGVSIAAVTRYCRYYLVDEVYSFDEEDCKKFNFKYFDLYSTPEIDLSGKENKGVYYVGNCRTEERRVLLMSVFEKLRNKIHCDFYMVGVRLELQKYSDDITYNHPLKYRDVISGLGKWNCILELVNSNQSGNTLRFKEAICYNKKLITNNPYVLQSKYYNPNWIMYFNSVEEINYEWILRDIIVDYQYSEEFSPNALLDQITGGSYENIEEN